MIREGMRFYGFVVGLLSINAFSKYLFKASFENIQRARSLLLHHLALISQPLVLFSTLAFKIISIENEEGVNLLQDVFLSAAGLFLVLFCYIVSGYFVLKEIDFLDEMDNAYCE